MTGTVELWDRLHTEQRHQLNFPSEEIVRFLAACKLHHPAGKALDLGCGSGRHMMAMRIFGYTPVGVDSSLEAVGLAAKHGETVHATMTDLPFPDNEFVLVVCAGVAYYGLWSETVAAFQEMRRVLKPGGRAFVTLRTFRDWRCGQGELVDRNTYLFDLPGEPEDGMTNSFVGEDEVAELLVGWSGVQVNLSERTTDSLRKLESDFRLVLEK